MIVKYFSKILFLIILVSHFNSFGAQNEEVFPFTAQYYRDATNGAKIDEIKTKKFIPTKTDIFNFGIDKAIFWIKLSVTKDLNFSDQTLFINNPRLYLCNVFIVDSIGNTQLIQPYNLFSNKDIKFTQGKIYNLPPNFNKHNVIYVQLATHEVFLTRITLNKQNRLLEDFSLRDIIFGIYTGIMAIMFIYNLFLFIIIRDESYLYYIFYILFIWLTQISIQGFAVKYFWEEKTIINHYAVVLFSSIGLTVASLFTISFLNTKVFSPNIHRLIVIYIF